MCTGDNIARFAIIRQPDEVSDRDREIATKNRGAAGARSYSVYKFKFMGEPARANANRTGDERGRARNRRNASDGNCFQ